MQFQVPQFIEVEDKIFGPMTFKQFVYVAGGAGTCYLLYRVLPIFLAAPLILGVGGLAAALAFMQFNGRPFILGLENAVFFFFRSKLYLWNNDKKKKASVENKLVVASQKAPLFVPSLSESKLHEMAWSLDIKERIAGGTADQEEREGKTVRAIVAPLRTARDAFGR